MKDAGIVAKLLGGDEAKKGVINMHDTVIPKGQPIPAGVTEVIDDGGYRWTYNSLGDVWELQDGESKWKVSSEWLSYHNGPLSYEDPKIVLELSRPAAQALWGLVDQHGGITLHWEVAQQLSDAGIGYRHSKEEESEHQSPTEP